MRKNSKKLTLGIVFVAVISMLMMLVAVADYSGTAGSASWTLDTSDGHLTVEGGSIPTYDNGTAPWYQYKSSIKTVEVKSGTTVSLGAFYGLENIETIVLPEVAGGYIGYAFGGVDYYQNAKSIPESLETVEISASASIGSYAFNNASSLKKVILADSVTTISEYAFKDCSALEKIVFGSGVSSISSNAFTRCNSLKYTFYNGTSTGWSQVSGNTAVTVSPICLDDGTFAVSAPSKTVYTLGEELDLTGFSATFAGSDCTEAAEVIAPDMTTVGAKTVTVMLGTKTAAFNISVTGTDTTGVSGIATWSINSGVLTISGNGMMDNYTLEILAPWYAHRDAITSVVVNEGITSVGSFAFYGLDSVASINIAASVETVGYSAFAECTTLSNLSLANTSAIVDGTAFKNCTALMTKSDNTTYIAVSSNAQYALVSVDASDSSFTISADTAVICDGAFKNSALTTISIPDSVISIGDNAFASSNALISVTIGSGIKKIGNYAFVDCSALTALNISATPDYIGAGAFNGTALSGTTSNGAVYLAAGSNDYAILWKASSTDITSCSLNASTEIIASLAFANCTALDAVQLNDGLLHIGDSAFNACSALYSIQIPSSLLTIGDQAFMNCSALTSVNLNGTLKTIGNGAFRGAAMLTKVVIGDTVENVGYNAFRNCSSLATLVFNAKSGVGYKVFAGCTALDDVYLADTVLSIGDYAFMGCTALNAIAVPDTTAAIGYGALYGCNSVVDIAVPFIGEKANGVNTSLAYIFGNAAPSKLNIVLVGSDIKAGAFDGINDISTLVIDKTTTSIAASSINLVPSTVYYLGSESEWSAVTKGSNAGLANVAFANSDFKLVSNNSNYPVGTVIDRENFTATIGTNDFTSILRFVNNPVTSSDTYLPAKLGSLVETFASKTITPIQFTDYSLLLEGSIGVKFYVSLSDKVVEDIDNVKAIVDYYGETYEVALIKADNTVDGSLYTAKFYVAAKEMRMPITLTINSSIATAQITKTVKEYVDYVNANSADYADCITLINDMFNYGEYSRHYFDNVTITPNPDLSNVTVTVPDKYTPTKSGSVTGLTLNSTSLLLESNTTVRHYFDLASDANINDYTFTVNGKQVTPQVKDGLYYVEVTNIIAKDLGKLDKTVITNGIETYTITYSPLSYVKLALANRLESDPDLGCLVKALYNYYVSATEYFTDNLEEIVPDLDESKPSIW